VDKNKLDKLMADINYQVSTIMPGMMHVCRSDGGGELRITVNINSGGIAGVRVAYEGRVK
jgi:hypothetical protein